MSDPKQARLLLAAAAEDLNLLHDSADRPAVTDRIFGHGVQQVAEKCLKAWICLLGHVYPFTHDLESLCAELAGHGADIERFGALTEFTDYAGVLRYQPTDPGRSFDRVGALALVETLLEKVRGLAQNLGADNIEMG